MHNEYRDATECREAGITYHLAVIEEWISQAESGSYVPSVFPADGFIHCTNGLDLLTEIANMFYQGSPDPRTVLVLDVANLTSEVRYDDPDQNFPHIYGPLNTDAVLSELPVERDSEGRFVRLGTH